MSMYWPSHSATQVVSYRRMSRRTFVSLKPSAVSRWSATRLRLKSMSPVLIACGMPCLRPQGRPVAPLDVAVLDVVVDQAEVVAELDGRGARQGRLVLAGDRGVGEEPEERPHPLAGRRAGPVEPEVVADHLVDAVGRRIAVPDERQDLVLGRGDQLGEVVAGGRGGHRGRVYVSDNVYVQGSLFGSHGARAPSGGAVLGTACTLRLLGVATSTRVVRRRSDTTHRPRLVDRPGG